MNATRCAQGAGEWEWEWVAAQSRRGRGRGCFCFSFFPLPLAGCPAACGPLLGACLFICLAAVRSRMVCVNQRCNSCDSSSVVDNPSNLFLGFALGALAG